MSVGRPVIIVLKVEKFLFHFTIGALVNNAQIKDKYVFAIPNISIRKNAAKVGLHHLCVRLFDTNT